MIDPGVQFKTVESNTLYADTDLDKNGANLGIEPISIHAEVLRYVTKPD